MNVSARNIGRLFLFLYGVGLLAFGVLFLVSPGSLTEMVDTVLPTPVSSMDIRAVYGGMFGGIGIFWLLCARDESLVRPGLVSLAVIIGGLVVGRTVGFVDGSPNALISSLYALEIVAMIVALIALRSDAGFASKPAGYG